MEHAFDLSGTEYLCIESKKVQELYSNLSNEYKEEINGSINKISLSGRIAILEELFGDQCLPDTLNTPKSGELKSQVMDNKPKFKVGELAMNYGKKCRVLEYNPDRKFPYVIHVLYNNNKYEVSESDLEPYTEENKETMEEKELNSKVLHNALCELESASIKVRKALISM